MALVYIDDAHYELLRLVAWLEEAGEGQLTERAIEALARQRALDPHAAEPRTADGVAGLDTVEGLVRRLRGSLLDVRRGARVGPRVGRAGRAGDWPDTDVRHVADVADKDAPTHRRLRCRAPTAEGLEAPGTLGGPPAPPAPAYVNRWYALEAIR